jgi:hypothetical protein
MSRRVMYFKQGTFAGSRSSAKLLAPYLLLSVSLAATNDARGQETAASDQATSALGAASEPLEVTAQSQNRPAGVATTNEPIEVTVQGESRPAGTTTISRSEARNLPGAFGDPFRAVEAQPGITPVVSGLPYFFLRGAPPGNVGYLVDGVRVPMLYHAFAGPAVIHPALLERTTVYRGAYPASIGRFAGGVVAAETQRPLGTTHAELNLRLFDAGAMVSAPFADGRGNIAVAGRYSYTALLLSLLVLDGTRLEYWDYQTRADYDMKRAGTVTLFAFGAHDLTASTRSNDVFSTDFHRIHAQHDISLGESTRVTTGFTFGTDRTRTSEQSSLASRSFGISTQLAQRFTPQIGATLGTDIWVEDYQSELAEVLRLQQVTPAGREVSAGLFLELPWFPARGVSVSPGIRTDYFGTSGQTARVGIDPRISARFRVNDRVQIAHSLGLAHQRPTFMPAALPGFQGAGLGTELQRSVQASSGVEVEIPFESTLSITAFDNIFYHITDPLGVTGEVNPNSLLQARALGKSYGLEFFLRRPITKRWGGSVSYTLSRSTRSHDQIQTLSAYDRPHVASAAVSYDLGRRWRIGTRLMAMSGVPTRRATTEGPLFDGDHRARAYYRLDARVEKRWLIGNTGWLALVFELLNATASTEVVRRTCNDRRCQESLFGPVTLPSVGIEASF